MRVRTPWIFDAAAGIYDGLTAQERWREHCRGMAASLPGRTILDLGIGPGVSGIEMARVKPGAIFVGVDLSAPMLLRAKRHAADAGVHLPLLRADAAVLPFPDASFDGATGHSFLYLLPDALRVLQETRRVVRPGGHVAFLEPGTLGAAARARAVLRSYRDGPRFGTSMLLWSVFSRLHGRYEPRTIEDQLTRAGFVEPRAEPALEGLGLVAVARRP
jgi:ubiquinone/menaquinone biosynthesis C-methylase UbiE